MYICPCPWQGGWTRWPLMVPSNPNLLGLLWYEGMAPAAGSKHHSLLSPSAAAVTEFHPVWSLTYRNPQKFFLQSQIIYCLSGTFLPVLTTLVLEKKNITNANYFKIELDFKTSITGSHYATSQQPKVFLRTQTLLSLQILTFFFHERSGLTSISLNLQDHYVVPQITDVQNCELQFVGYVQWEDKQSSMSCLIARLTNNRDPVLQHCFCSSASSCLFSEAERISTALWWHWNLSLCGWPPSQGGLEGLLDSHSSPDVSELQMMFAGQGKSWGFSVAAAVPDKLIEVQEGDRNYMCIKEVKTWQKRWD